MGIWAGMTNFTAEMRDMVAIIGPTASGKTLLAATLASRIGGEVISGDSRQVYRGMDIGTGKDLADYDVGGVCVPYHLIDIVEPGTRYNVFKYQKDFLAVYKDVKGRGAVPVLCGGSGLYVEAVLRSYHLTSVPENKELRERLKDKSLPELTAMLASLKKRNGTAMHNITDVDTAQRAIRAIEIETFNGEHPDVPADMPRIETAVFGVYVDRDERRRRITCRLEKRLREGMADEIRRLMDKGIRAEDLMYYGLEYKYVTEYVIGRMTYDEMFDKLQTAIHQFAKRQMTWFRGMERRGIDIRWIDGAASMDDKIEYILQYI